MFPVFTPSVDGGRERGAAMDEELLHLLKRRVHKSSDYTYGLFSLHDSILAAKLSAQSPYKLGLAVRRAGLAQFTTTPPEGIERLVYDDGLILSYERLHPKEYAQFLRVLEGQFKERDL